MKSAQINELCQFAYIADKESRSDLCRGYIKDENDYTSNFTGALRRIINSNSSTNLSATSYNLSSQLERKYGCDATIIIQSNNFTKIIIFEAKWPRMMTVNYRWDYPQTASKLSHYSDQLDRQALYNRNIAIFEMFYCEFYPSKQPSYMHGEVSSCVWHKTAFNFKGKRSNPSNIWTQTDIVNLLTIQNLSISDILREVCICNIGKPINISSPNDIIKEFRLSGNILIVQTDKDN